MFSWERGEEEEVGNLDILDEDGGVAFPKLACWDEPAWRDNGVWADDASSFELGAIEDERSGSDDDVVIDDAAFQDSTIADFGSLS